MMMTLILCMQFPTQQITNPTQMETMPMVPANVAVPEILPVTEIPHTPTPALETRIYP